ELDAPLLLLAQDHVERLAEHRGRAAVDERALAGPGHVGAVHVRDDDEVRARLDREIDAEGAHDLAVDEVAVADLVRPKEEGDAARGGDRLADRHPVPVALPEDDPPAPVDVGGGDQHRAVELAEVVLGQAASEEALEAIDREEPAREPAGGGPLLAG